jgi:small subunit ribosomal protein S6
LRDYELVVVVKPEAPEENVKRVVEKVNKMLAGRGGTVGEVEEWGKRRLAYPLKHYREGHYILLRCKLEPKFAGEIESSLKLSEEVLRHSLARA